MKTTTEEQNRATEHRRSSVAVELEELRMKNRLSFFGYGSLIWNPGFEYDSKELGCIRGYERRFWQGSVHHRGTEENPGRVLTAIKKPGGVAYGVTYHVIGKEKIQKALEALGVRETLLGGYKSMLLDFYPASDNWISDTPSCQVVLYIALPHNPLFAGHDPEEEIAHQVAKCEGVCGPNSDYILGVANFMKKVFPSVYEHHLYAISTRLERILAEKKYKEKLAFFKRSANKKSSSTRRNSGFVESPQMGASFFASGAASKRRMSSAVVTLERGENVLFDSFSCEVASGRIDTSANQETLKSMTNIEFETAKLVLA